MLRLHVITYHAHFLHFDYIMRLTPFDFHEVKWLNSYIFMRYVDARTCVKFNGSMYAPPF